MPEETNKGYPKKKDDVVIWQHGLNIYRITESQNHRMVGVGRDLCGSSSPTLLPKQGHLEQAVQDLVQAGLEHLQRRLHSLPGQPVLVLRYPQREEVLLHVQMELPLLQFVPIALCPVAGHYWKEFGPILLTSTHRLLAWNGFPIVSWQTDCWQLDWKRGISGGWEVGWTMRVRCHAWYKVLLMATD